MAASKWLDPWAFANWTDATQSPLPSHVWDALKGAADERKSIAQFTHDSGFTEYVFPDFNADKSLMYSDSPVNLFDNEVLQIVNGSFALESVETDDIQTSGTVVSTSPANLYTSVAEILTDEFSYASGTPLIRTDTDTGSQNAVALWSWFIQCFQMLNYPVYYLRRLKNNATGNQFYNTMELQEVKIEVTYNYDVSPFSFNSAVADVTIRTSGSTPTPTDVYVTNDLSESGAPSTPQQVRDYAITTWGNNNSTWWSLITHDLGDKGNFAYLREGNFSIHFASLVEEIQCEIVVHRIRFKTNDDYRPTSPNRYDTPKYWNGYYSGSTDFTANIASGGSPGTPPTISSYNDFGTGETNNEVQLNLMVEDVSDYYNIEIDSPDFDTESTIGFPPDPGAGNGTSSWTQEFNLQALQLEAGTTLSGTFKQTDPTLGVNDTPQVSQTDTSIYVKANTTDGNNFEYYTPAP